MRKVFCLLPKCPRKAAFRGCFDASAFETKNMVESGMVAGVPARLIRKIGI